MDIDAYIGDGILKLLFIRLYNTIFCMPNFKKFHTIFECIDYILKAPCLSGLWIKQGEASGHHFSRPV